mmetsp:Transcript_20950/g.37562  ORF Transcript_20950/g.37562 Transcript_20950/m.37562 type:complete len:225 (-) Transcript_20950:163-837(-)
MFQRIPTMIPGVIFLLADWADRFHLHGTIRRPAAKFRHILQLGDHRYIGQDESAVFSLDQNLVRECHNNVSHLPRQSLVSIPLTAKFATSVIFLASIAHGQSFLWERHIKGLGHSVGVHRANLRRGLRRGRRYPPRHGVRLRLRRCHHGHCAASSWHGHGERHHGLRGVGECGWHLIAVAHAWGRGGHGARTHRGREGRGRPRFASSCFGCIVRWGRLGFVLNC